MTKVANFIASDRVRCREPIQSKKRTLEMAASLLSSAIPGIPRVDIFEALNARERLGSTGLGHGVALPHARLGGINEPVAACITLAEPIDFDAPDRERVDILFCLLVPKDCNDEHLQILAGLAELFSDADLRDRFREDADPQSICDCLEDVPGADNRAVGGGN